jgi:hypothetical protein
MSTGVRTRISSEESLAAYVRGLSAGSPCFCCGEAMRSSRRTGAGALDLVDGGSMICPRCGSEVAGATDGAREPERTDERPSDSLTVAA